jgi:flagellar basal-body rod protein FlgB
MDSKIFGLSGAALQLCEDRAVLITNNLVNSSTPHYKAKDIAFSDAMNAAKENITLAVTQPGHLSSPINTIDNQNIMYRVPMQMSLDGNTVDPEIERKNFIENSLRYNVNLTFIQGKTDELSKAIKGE